MSEEHYIRLLCRTQWRDEGDLTPPKILRPHECFWWHLEVRMIEQEEAQSA